MFGWQNSATIGSVVSYNLYWLVVIIGFVVMRFRETRGHWPLQKPRAGSLGSKGRSDSSSDEEANNRSEKTDGAKATVIES